MKIASLHSLASLIAVALAQANDEGVETWHSPGQFGASDTVIRYFKQAIARPNATRSTEFTPFEGQNVEHLNLGNTTWTWRVNVTEFVLPEEEVRNSPAGADARNVVSSAQDFSWPRGGNISTEVYGTNASSSGPLCVMTVKNPMFWPANLTNSFTGYDSDSTSCAPALGQACVDAILHQNITTEYGCSFNGSWHLPSECREAFSFVYDPELSRYDRDIRYHLQELTFNDDDDESGEEYVSGDRFMSFTTDRFDPDDDDHYNDKTFVNTARHLQVLMMQTLPDPSNNDTRASQLLCMRVDTSEYEDESAALSLHETLGSAWLMIVAVGLLFATA